MTSIVALIMFATNLMGQQIIKCDSTKSFWAIENDSIKYAVKLSGKSQTTERFHVIAVNDYALQYLIVEKSNYIKEGEDNSDLKVLIRYALSEAEFLSEQFKAKINLQMIKAPLSQDKDVLIWYYEMPQGMNEQVKFQLYSNIIIGDKIIGFASPQFSDQKFESVRDFLMDIISTLKVVSDINTLCDK